MNAQRIRDPRPTSTRSLAGPKGYTRSASSFQGRLSTAGVVTSRVNETDISAPCVPAEESSIIFAEDVSSDAPATSTCSCERPAGHYRSAVCRPFPLSAIYFETDPEDEEHNSTTTDNSSDISKAQFIALESSYVNTQHISDPRPFSARSLAGPKGYSCNTTVVPPRPPTFPSNGYRAVQTVHFIREPRFQNSQTSGSICDVQLQPACSRPQPKGFRSSALLHP